jgi:DJ-1/PfpI family
LGPSPTACGKRLSFAAVQLIYISALHRLDQQFAERPHQGINAVRRIPRCGPVDTQPRKTLDQAGADTRVVSPKDDEVRSWNFTDWGQKKLPVDLKLDEARPQDFEALLLPGGVINPDKLRMIPAAVAFVKAFFDAGANPSQRSAMAPGRSSRRTRPAAGV